jgi:16S rRNA (adenine1518-N6/adenine1519-N6)-dimethyltransferase
MGSSMTEPLPFSGAPYDVRRMLKQAGLRPRKSLGQNFLVDEDALRRVASAAEIQSEDVLLEIGAGPGSLTRHLAAQACRVVAVEIDPLLIPLLKAALSAFSNVSIVPGDILALPIEELVGSAAPGNYKVAANIPYYITSAIVRRLMESNVPPNLMVLTVQKEVADRICAPPGKMSLLSLSVQYYGTPAVVGRIPADAFYPVPKVDSVIVRVELRNPAVRNVEQAGRLFRVARAGFSQKRKMLRNTLSAGFRLPPKDVEALLDRAGVDPKRRAETLAVEEWVKLAEVFPQGCTEKSSSNEISE